MADWAILVLRVCLAAVFIGHGAQVAFGLFGGPGIHPFSEMLSGMGFKPAVIWAYLAAYTELLGGLFIAVGALTRISALFIAIFMLVAVYKVHLSKGFFIQTGGWEYNFVLICICVALMLLGPGKYGISNKF